MESDESCLWKPYYNRGELVWIEGSDGRFIKGQVINIHVAKDHNSKGKKRYPSYRNPSALYYVFCFLAKEIQPSAGKRHTVKVKISQHYPRKEGN